MPDLFTVTDAYHGVQVRLEESTWYRHVLQGHPNMATHLEDAKRALTDPCAVLSSKHYPDRLLYHYALPLRGGLYVRVVVRMRQDRDGAVVAGIVMTSFVTDTIGGGEVEWLPR